jgi:hypothetical protein
VSEVIPVGSLQPVGTARKTLEGRTFEHPSCGGFMSTAETTLIPVSDNHAAKRSLMSDARLDNEPILVADCVAALGKPNAPLSTRSTEFLRAVCCCHPKM